MAQRSYPWSEVAQEEQDITTGGSIIYHCRESCVRGSSCPYGQLGRLSQSSLSAQSHTGRDNRPEPSQSKTAATQKKTVAQALEEHKQEKCHVDKESVWYLEFVLLHAGWLLAAGTHSNTTA